MSSVVVRFAPSPTGYLHIGGARTALFNWLFAKKSNGKFLIRIEDTDRTRSHERYERDILENMLWLGLLPDDPQTYQSQQFHRHRDIVFELLRRKQAYYCTCSKERLHAMRLKAQKEGKHFSYDRLCRGKEHFQPPRDQPAVVRFKMPLDGTSNINDEVQGKISIENKQMDDLIILREDGTPTYNLCVVVDDHDMQISHIVRGTDHIANTFRQKAIYESLGWILPKTAHIPLIHDAAGHKMSKRTGSEHIIKPLADISEAMFGYATRVKDAEDKAIPLDATLTAEKAFLESEAATPNSLVDDLYLENIRERAGPIPTEVRYYRRLGYLPEAILNYLARLGWSHGNEEIFTTVQAQKWFSFKNVGKSPARFDPQKILHLSAHYLRKESDRTTIQRLERRGRHGAANGLPYVYPFTPNRDKIVYQRMKHVLPAIKKRAKTLVDIEKDAAFLRHDFMQAYLEGGKTFYTPIIAAPLHYDFMQYTEEGDFALGETHVKAESLLLSGGCDVLSLILPVLEKLDKTQWTHDILEKTIREFIADSGLSLKAIAQSIRAALTGTLSSPGLFDILLALGRKESMDRINLSINYIQKKRSAQKGKILP